MTKFCTSCGKELADDAKTCGACEKAVPIESSILNQQTIDDAKKKFANATSIIRDNSAKAAGQFREELKGINEARSRAFEEGKDGPSAGSIDKAKTLSKSFWLNLTGLQRAILIIFAVLLVGAPVFVYQHSGDENENTDSEKEYQTRQRTMRSDGRPAAIFQADREAKEHARQKSGRGEDPYAELQTAYVGFDDRCRANFGSSTGELILEIRKIRNAGGTLSQGMGSVQGQLQMLKIQKCAL